MSTNHGTLVITAADYCLGYHVADHVTERYRKHFDKFVVTCVHPDRCEHLKKKADVVKINPNEEQTYKDAFEGASWILFFTEPESGRVQAANRAIDAMKKANVNNVMMISMDAADCADPKELPYIAEFKEMEEKLCATMKNHVIVKCSLIQHMLHLHAPYVTKNYTFPMTLPEDVKFVPVHLDDVMDACVAIVKDGIEKHRSQSYTLTGPEEVTGPKAASVLTKAVQSPKEIQYEQISRSDMEKYLKSLRDSIGKQSSEKDKDSEGDHDHLGRKFKGQPTDHQIHTYVEEMEWLKAGGSKKMDDLKKLIGREGHSLENFFSDHKNEFRPSR